MQLLSFLVFRRWKYESLSRRKREHFTTESYIEIFLIWYLPVVSRSSSRKPPCFHAGREGRCQRKHMMELLETIPQDKALNTFIAMQGASFRYSRSGCILRHGDLRFFWLNFADKPLCIVHTGSDCTRKTPHNLQLKRIDEKWLPSLLRICGTCGLERHRQKVDFGRFFIPLFERTSSSWKKTNGALSSQ